MSSPLTDILRIEGEVFTDSLHRSIYATDASAYRELPRAVVCPKGKNDIKKIVRYAYDAGESIIPRAAGTSLAGQVVGNGIVVDVSRHLNRIIKINREEHWALVEPGVVLDELNIACKPYGLFFGPETSTSNRCCVGGMVGNNSCGSHSLVYGSTRDHLLEAEVVLSDGSEAVFKAMTKAELDAKCGAAEAVKLEKRIGAPKSGVEESVSKPNGRAAGEGEIGTLEARIYRGLRDILSDDGNQRSIREGFPDRDLKRRNTGYALDLLLEDRAFNLCKILAGSEGTLAFATRLKLNLLPLPPKEKALICVHCNSMDEAFEANIEALKHRPVAVELIDGAILRLSKSNIEQNKNRFFINGDPEALIVIEVDADEETSKDADNKEKFISKDLTADGPKEAESETGREDTKQAGNETGREDTKQADIETGREETKQAESETGREDTKEAESEERNGMSAQVRLNARVNEIIEALKGEGIGYDYPIVSGEDITKVWALRKAGLGLLSGMSGDSKPVSLIEDTAVAPKRLSEYIRNIRQMLADHGLDCVYYGHISTGEFHLRPILNLKDPKDRQTFREVGYETALIVRKHRGSLSGEHGDGRLRSEFIPIIIGEENYHLLERVKDIFDPKGIFNPGKIVRAVKMDRNLRYETSPQDNMHTCFDFSEQNDWLCAIEQCNGSADCRKSVKFTGAMCPSFRATKEEDHTPRARANILREMILHPDGRNIFDQKDILKALDTCLSCKACKAECPSNVDMTRFKAEYLQHHYATTLGPGLRTRLVANFAKMIRIGNDFRNIYNHLVSSLGVSAFVKKVLNFAPERSLPIVSNTTLRRWYKKEHNAENAAVTLTGASQYGRVIVSGSGQRNSNAAVRCASKGAVYLFADEFTDNIDVNTGICFVRLLERLGYEVIIPQ
ncbi:MAG: FAD-linked oxidase C-terminal domain-containing protein, partial [Bacteroidales bacterium]